ncbi:hypothetical protein CASFOL_009777 [Castilleja foliolosa]|uniref:SBP-type domain-containing protein n=1 Tax=Castilleja foliolosa TaxID=1961234 RepID=A0ABD3DSZ6_9LAMI
MESLSYAFTDHTDFQADDLFPEITRKSLLDDQRLQISCDDSNNRSIESLNSASTLTLNSVMEFETRFSSLANDDSRFSVVSAKRAKITNLSSSIPTCQVLGCNKDLSNSKDYHKRHRVCDVHSKTAVVIVNGFEQRFCQQCSRFHRLAEFDEGKRSCRKRLAGHNERRRKPQFDTYLGSTYLTNDATKTSLLFPSIIPNGILYDPRCNKPISFPNSQSRAKQGLQTPLSVHDSSSMSSNSSCALSLLSSPQSMPHPLISEENYFTNLRDLQNSAKPNFTKNVSSNFTPTSFNASEISQDFIDTVCRNSCPSVEGSKTVNLVELSLHLQRVEQQKYSGQVKLENRVFCNSANT